jgi:low affinity Fe/Cu permease
MMNHPASKQSGKQDDASCGVPNGAKPECRRDLFGRIAAWTARASGSRWASLGALATVIVWAASGPYYRYSETWQLVINTGTTIVTFLMVFLIQNSQNRESKAVHLKLDELIHAVRHADNRMINIEKLTEEQLDQLAGHYEQIARPLHEKIEAAVEHVNEKIDDHPGHHNSRPEDDPDSGEVAAAVALEASASRLGRRLPTTSLIEPIPSPSSTVSNS